MRAVGLMVTVALVAMLLMGQASQRFDWLIAKQLTVTNATELDDATLTGDLTLTVGDATLTAGDLTVTAGDLVVTAGDATVGGDLTVTGSIVAAAYLTTGGDVDIDADLTVDNLTVVTDATVGGDIAVTGDATVGDDATITGDLFVTATTTLVGATDMQGNVSDSGGALTVADNVLIDGAADVVQLTVQGYTTNTNNLLVVENSAGTDQFTVSATGDATVTDDLIVTDDLTSNDLTVADFVNITAQGVITLTDNAVLTATGSLQPILAEAGIGIDGGTNIAHVTDYLILVNIGAQTITFTETTGLISAGNVALGAGDATTLVWADSGWIEISRSNN